jgi:peptide/nickel transport system permease protein
MVAYLVRRALYGVVMLMLISVVGFAVIQAPPGDYLTTYIARLERQGDHSARMRINELKARYGLDKSIPEQYWIWISHFGRSFAYEQPVAELFGQRMVLTIALTLATMLIEYTIAIPIGIFSATHQYSFWDQVFTTISFIGLGVPGFLLALVLLFVSTFSFGQSIGGLFSDKFVNAPWSLARVIDLLKHLWIPALITAVSGTAGTIRMLRANLLDILGQPFILAARARGLKERVVILKHAVRMAINPLVTVLGMSLPGLISGTALVAMVLNLPEAGPLYLQALQSQDMFMAGTYLMFLSIMLVIGNLLADVALAWVDPRIRFD